AFEIAGKGVASPDAMILAVEYATKMGAKVAQYDTASDNHASISLAKYYGFKEKKRMELLIANHNEIKIKEKIKSKNQRFTADVARNLYNKFDIGPGEEICIGWSFIPYKYLTDDHGIWICNNDAILLKIDFGSNQDYEQPLEQEIWLIVYGKANAATELIQFILQEELETKDAEHIVIFCNSEIAKHIKKIGFKYPEDKPLGVVLFEKTLI
ncbi:MAG: hypothetical protein ACFFBP_18555, partial [Promethearchaeota archaeon]